LWKSTGERRPLLPAQAVYAALDAWVLPEIVFCLLRDESARSATAGS
jgi:hypothetical protein